MTDTLDPRQRIRDLEVALARERALVEQERRRADLAEMSTRRAWELSTWTRPSGLQRSALRTDVDRLRSKLPTRGIGDGGC